MKTEAEQPSDVLGYIKKLDEEQNPKEEYYNSESHNAVRAPVCSVTLRRF